MASNSKSLKIPDVTLNILHFILLGLIFLIIRLFPILRRPYLYASSLYGAWHIYLIFGYANIWFVLSFLFFFVLVLLDNLVVSPRLQNDILGIKHKTLISLIVGLLGVLFGASYYLEFSSEILLIIATTQFFLLPWFGILSQKCVLLAKSRTFDKDASIQMEIFRSMLHKLRESLEGRADVYIRKEGQELLQTLSLLGQSIDVAKSQEIELLMVAILSAELSLKSGEIESANTLLSENLTVKALLDRFELRNKLLEYEINLKHSFWQRHAIAIIHAYRKLLPARYRRSCRYTPTCSEYAEQSILLHGFFNGLRISLARASSCVPNGGRGVDLPPIDFCRNIDNY